MQQRILLTLTCTLFLTLTLQSQQSVRSYDGSSNNPTHPTRGAVGASMPRISPATYDDNIGSIGGNDRPNPRAVSNAVFAQSELFADPRNMSDYCWVWGQFIDHDIVLVGDSDEFMYIQVPEGDTYFDPWSTGASLIPMRRSAPIPGTGTAADNPLQYPNAITSFIDGSAVYGSSLEHANWLRTFMGGKLKTSAGNLLPYNTTTGELNAPIDPTAPHMEDATGQLEKLFVAGDVRVNENNLLTAMHTLFMREHNYQCDLIKQQHPNWNDELIYQHARRKVGGIIAAITFDEWLPAMGVELPSYFAYVENLDPTISNEFSAAAFRLGHTLLSANIRRMDMEGNTIPEGDLPLLEAFFRPDKVAEVGLDPLFKGMATQVQQDMDGKVVDAVRNFLFGPAGAGGLDLASINIARGRERGLADFNTIRTSLGLEAYQDFEDLTEDDDLADILGNQLGYDIDNLDPWVGFLVENHMPNALFGESLMKVMEAQFFNLREGDRFYFENDDNLSNAEKAEIKATRLSDVVMRNTAIPTVQDDVFFAMPHDMLCAASEPEASLSGFLQTSDGDNISNVSVRLKDLSTDETVENMSSDSGFFIEGAATCEAYSVTPYKNTNHDNGVTTSDVVRIRRHILNIDPLTSPYRLLAADVNNSGGVTTSDLVEIRRLILTIEDEFVSNTSWRFIDADYEFTQPTAPWADDFPESIIVESLLDDVQDVNFIAVKIGDVNESANPNALAGEGEERTDEEPFLLTVEDQVLETDKVHTIGFSAADISNIEAFQFTLNYNTDYLDFVEMKAGSLPDFAANNFYVMPTAGALTVSWDSDKAMNGNEDLFYLSFRAKKGLKKMCEVLTINSRYTKAEAYLRQDNGAVKDMALLFNSAEGEILVHNSFELYQNIPNPVAEQTKIGFYLPQAAHAVLTISTADGKVVKTISAEFDEGINNVYLQRSEIPAKGLLFYTIESPLGTATKQMFTLD